MNEDFHDFFFEGEGNKHFHQVIILHESPGLVWEDLSKLIPLLPRGWYELARLPIEDRIEFTHDYWEAKLPFVNVHLEKKLSEFFDNIEEIGIYATQEKRGGIFDVHMVYGLKEGAGFFQGGPPASDEAIETLVKQFSPIHFPPDYLAFLKIHDGFSKYTDTGIIKTRDMAQIYQRLQHLLAEELLVRPDGQMIDPAHLIPFYESFGLHSYQCFYADWYPEEDMGTVYFSEHERSISNFLDNDNLEANLAFPSFFGWLVFYLEDIGHL